MPIYREATLADLPAICRLGREINAIHHAAWPDIFTSAGDPQRDEALWRASIGAPDSITFVAEEGDGVVGFANVSFVAVEPNPLVWPVPHARVGSVGVAPSHRGRGIGRVLMGRIEAWAAARGARRISLNVWAFNRRAVELYEELGYEVRSYSMGKRLGPAEAAPPMPVGVPRLDSRIRPATANDAQPVSELVHLSFNALSARDWSPAARQRFLAESSADRLRATIPEAAFAAVAVADRQIVGFVLMPAPHVLGMLFVHPRALRQGIARSLWEAARADVEARHPEVATVELNSTPYASAAYRALGFAEISRPFDLDGCVATRMACWLPARRLSAVR